MSVRPLTHDNNARGARALLLALAIALPGAASSALPAPVSPGIDVWQARGFAPLAGKRIGLITNVTGRDATGTATLDILASSAAIELAAVFATEHGLAARLEGTIEHGTHAPTGLPVHSLYREPYRPTAAMLGGLDALVFDIQDVGARFYTYGTTMAYAMEEAARHGLGFVVLDRPNPIGGEAMSGPVAEAALASFVSYAEIPTRHGMTLGELALYYNEQLNIGAELIVVPAAGWRRQDWYDATGLAWIDPSPNIRNLTQALLYPALGALETTNVSVGRGTGAPFEWIGAPWMQGQALAAALNSAGLPGVRFIPRRQTPDSGPYAGEECDGVNLLVIDRGSFDAGRTAAVLATSLWRLHARDWDIESLPRQWGNRAILEQLRQDWSAERIVDSWQERLEQFRLVRERYLLYR